MMRRLPEGTASGEYPWIPRVGPQIRRAHCRYIRPISARERGSPSPMMK
jgi:hypothetical protein